MQIVIAADHKGKGSLAWRHIAVCVAMIVFAAGVTGCGFWPRPPERARGPLPYEAYVWQRLWTDPLRRVVAQAAPKLAGLVVLNAEISWERGQIRVVRIPIDFAVLRAAARPVGVALRIGPYPGPFAAQDALTTLLVDLAASLVVEAGKHHLRLAELQIDFDCADSRLEGYRVWVEAIRRKVAPVPVTITALPSWLSRRELKRLAAAADGFVLQVHSLAWPTGSNASFDKLRTGSFSLCDPAAARQAVERAARLGVPFRVALPTYGYVVAFDRQGRPVGMSAEGLSLTWPQGTRLRDVRADPTAMAALVRAWTKDRPANLRGVIWYRLPTGEDRLNWSWQTLSAVMAGRAPRGALQVEARRPRPGLVEVDLVNGGEADCSLPLVVSMRWQDARLVAGDALQGFEWIDAGPTEVRLRATSDLALVRLAPGQRRMIGWLRLGQDTEVEVDVSPTSY